MHELSIALSILDIVSETCAARGCGRVDRVRVKVGKASGVMTDALRFSFDCAKAGTPAADAVLEIVDVPLGGHCRDCGERFTAGGKYVLGCPHCGGAAFTVDSGHELEVVDLEVEE